MNPSEHAELPKAYRPADHENRIRERWMSAKAFSADPGRVVRGEAKPYAIVIPPPNVTARLHLGHALNNTLQDVLTRAHRMMGYEAMWMPGTDHAGIATQAVVERRLWEEEKKRRHDFTREAFVQRVQAWKDDYEKQITDQLKLMGCSCDFDRQRFTMDDICARAVREAFFRLFRDGLIYRGKRLVNWDPALQTAVADDECFDEEVATSFWYLRYPLVHNTPGDARPVTWDELASRGYPGAQEHPSDQPAWVTVATTRPETYLADTGVAVNPHDPRAKALRGLHVELPLVGRIIPIVEDSYVVLPEAYARNDEEKNDPKAKFATGFLKVTPGHDKNDWELGQRHKLPVINMMSPDGKVSDKHGWTDVGSAHLFVGLTMAEARKKVVAEFKSHGLLEAIKPYTQTQTFSDRSKAQVEPFLSDQWYVRVTDPRMAQTANAALVAEQRSGNSAGEGRITPGSMTDAGKSGTDAGQSGTNGKQLGTNGRQLGANGERSGANAGTLGTNSGVSGADAGRNAGEVGGVGGGVGGGDGSMRFYPSRYSRTFEQWHDNIRDWCISRQLWWGHRIPVWTAPGVLVGDAEWSDGLEDKLDEWEAEGRIAIITGDPARSNDPNFKDLSTHICVRDPEGVDKHIVQWLETALNSPHVSTSFGGPLWVDGERIERTNFTQDSDVLDTWFSSALWPLSTMGWPDAALAAKESGDASMTHLLSAFNPTSTLCTAREIITLWVSRMTMFNRYFQEGAIPFKDVYIHAVVQDGEGQKMSKSLGNGVDPIDIIETHGSDAMRFTLCHIATQTQDVRLPVDVLDPHTGETFTPKMVTNSRGDRVAAPVQEHKGKKMISSYGVASGEAREHTGSLPVAKNTSAKFDLGRNFANKLWNASRFTLSILDKGGGYTSPHFYTIVDAWMLSRLAKATKEIEHALANYEFSNYATHLYRFIWDEFCDWYLEAIKPTVSNSLNQRAILANVLRGAITLAHPVMPFITETIWEQLSPRLEGLPQIHGVSFAMPRKGGLLCVAGWPEVEPGDSGSEQAHATFDKLRGLITEVRTVRALHNVPPKRLVRLHRFNSHAQLWNEDSLIPGLVQQLAGVNQTTSLLPDGPHVNFQFDNQPYALSNLADAVDAGAERARLTKLIADREKSVSTMQGRLNNPGYAAKAPPAMVEQTKAQLAKDQAELDAAKAALAALPA